MKLSRRVFVALGIIAAALVVTSVQINAQVTPVTVISSIDSTGQSCFVIGIPTADDNGVDISGTVLIVNVSDPMGNVCASGPATAGIDTSKILCFQLADCTNTVFSGNFNGWTNVEFPADLSPFCGPQENQNAPTEQQPPADPVS